MLTAGPGGFAQAESEVLQRLNAIVDQISSTTPNGQAPDRNP